MSRCSRILRVPTERSWSWAPHKKKREVADFAPLRVLFCGSDAFSVPTFDMLREMHLRRTDVVSALSVITPVDKLSGRGLKIAKPAPMTLLAKRMQYPVSHVKEFSLKADELPDGEWDLIVAVSFGHKIPAAVLNKMKVGGLNIHPSLLPRYQGPAPIHRALLNQDQESGVTLQTIHPTEIDKGSILLQSDPIPLSGVSFSSLYSTTSRIGASMLKDLLLQGYPVNAPDPITPPYNESYAAKVQKAETQINWSTWSAERIQLWSKTMNSLWTTLNQVVVKLNNLEVISGVHDDSAVPGSIRLSEMPENDLNPGLACIVKCQDGWVQVGSLTIAGKKEKQGSNAKELHGKQFESTSVQ